MINISAYLLRQYIVNFQSNELLLARLQAYKYNIREKGRANFMADVGKMIKKLREEANMTQDNLAEKMNVTRQAVSNWENGKTSPDIDTLFRLSQVFNVSIEEIIYGEKRNTVTNVTNITNQTIKKHGKSGIGFGVALAMIISYVKWQSIGWAIFHGLLNWIYVIYYIINYVWNA